MEEKIAGNGCGEGGWGVGENNAFFISSSPHLPSVE